MRSLILLLVPLCQAQSFLKFSPDLKFEVATIKPAGPMDPNNYVAGLRPAPGGERYVATNAPLRMMLTSAFRVREDQIVGGPEWNGSDRFDMNAKAEEPSSHDALRSMLLNLLTDRFQIKFHHEKRDLPRYALTVDRNGPKM